MKKRKVPYDALELASMAGEALRLAVYEAVKDHKRTGDPVVIWKNGRVIHVPAKKLRLQKPRLKYLRRKV